MDEASLTALLDAVASGQLDVNAAKARLRHLPFQQVEGFATLDTHRALRTGFPEVVFCAGKTDDQIVAIVTALAARENRVLCTRMRPETADKLTAAGFAGLYHATARLWALHVETPPPAVGLIACCCAGTSDLPVFEEAALTAETMGSKVERLADVGVAGIHRLLRHAELLQQANVVVVVAGMEGALASVVGGLVAAPVIAVPTSVGYGANFGGLAPLLTMLNSCAAGVSVVNIDNGFGGGYCSHVINAAIARAAAAPAGTAEGSP
jgi:NCAIR mutase (PurE)-related protein